MNTHTNTLIVATGLPAHRDNEPVNRPGELTSASRLYLDSGGDDISVHAVHFSVSYCEQLSLCVMSLVYNIQYLYRSLLNLKCVYCACWQCVVQCVVCSVVQCVVWLQSLCTVLTVETTRQDVFSV